MNGCHKCPAYGNCTVNYRGSACAAVRYSHGIAEDPEILTNGDKIRAMTDDELVNHINKFNICDIRTSQECKGRFVADCDECVLDWLKQPAEE